ncbi:MAG: hypothetical protein ACREBC_10160 [Pyrinomonadaceae bacterium]
MLEDRFLRRYDVTEHKEFLILLVFTFYALEGGTRSAPAARSYKNLVAQD